MPLIIDWWWFIPICFTGAFLWPVSGVKNFIIAFAMIFFIWVLWAWKQDFNTHVSVAATLGEIFGNLPSISIYIITGVVGGLPGGLAALSGYLLSKSKKN